MDLVVSDSLYYSGEMHEQALVQGGQRCSRGVPGYNDKMEERTLTPTGW